MITINTPEYKRAQELANNIFAAAKTTRINAQMFEVYDDELTRLLEQVAALDCFAAQVANTILPKVGKTFSVAYVSSKQAWVIACAVIENNIPFRTAYKYSHLAPKC